MTAYNGGALELELPNLTPRQVSTVNYTESMRANVFPLQTDFPDLTDRSDLQPRIDANSNTTYVITAPSIQTDAWPSRLGSGRDSGFTAPNWVDTAGFDWFDRFHPQVPRIDLGAFVSTSTALPLYSAFRTDVQQLDGMSLTTGADTSLLNEPGYPYQHPAQNSLTVTFQAGPLGPAVLNGAVTFDYVIEDVIIPVTGQRVFVLHWIPEDGVQEILEWKTNILKAVNTEQRIALRATPRTTRKFTFYVSNEERMELEKDLGSREVLYTAPAWWDARYITNVTVADTVIPVDTDFAEFEDGMLVLFVEPESKVFEVKTIQSVGVNQLTLTEGLDNSFSTGFAIPVLPGVLKTSTIQVQNNDHYFVSVEIIATEHYERTIPSYTQVDSIDVLEERPKRTSPIPVTITRAGKMADNGIGVVGFTPTENRPRAQERFQWEQNGREARSDLKDWLWSRVGRQKPFLFPSWQGDFTIHTDNYAAGSGVLNVKTTALEAPFYIQVELTTGVNHVTEVTSINKDVGFDTLTLVPAIASAFTTDEVKYISKVRNMRHASDSITITYSKHNRSSAAINCIEV